MKIIKPQNLGLLFKGCFLDKQTCLSISACACFPLDEGAPERLIDETEMWPIIEAALGTDEIFDFGIPKARGEFLVYGSAFSPQPVRGLEVRVRVGDLAKTLVVSGDRYWKIVGAGEPEPFTSMPIHYGNAFGGPDFPANPLGKGASPDATGNHPLPNIQDPRHLIGSPHDAPAPVGFTGYPITWPQRMRHLGKVDDRWLHEDWPDFPRDTNWELFNAAPEDQRLQGFLSGGEKIEIRNMHPTKSSISSALPALRPRIFVNRREGEKEVFREVPCRAETLWLFPEREVGVLLYRGAVTMADEDYEDILHLYGQWESLTGEPKPIEEYDRMFREELAPVEPEAAAEPQAPEPSAAPAAAAVKAPPEASAIHPELAALMKEAQDLEAMATEMLNKAGIDPEAAIRQFAPVEERAAAGSLEELRLAAEALEKQTADFMKRFNISTADVEKIMAPKPEPPLKSADEIIAGLREAGIYKPEVEARFREVGQEAQKAEAALDGLKNPPEAAKASTEAPLPPAGPALTVEEAISRYERGETLGGLDLSGPDFSGRKMDGADFSGAMLMGAIFMKADLRNALFKSVVLKDADFREADLTLANLEKVDATGGRFTRTRLPGAKLSGGDFTEADFTEADLSGAEAVEAVFEQARMEGVTAQKIRAPKALFAGANLADADLTGAEIPDADFSGANISDCMLNLTNAAGLRLSGATGERTKFGRALLTGSRADADTILTDGRFFVTELTDACWEGARLQRAQMVAALLDRSDFSKCDLTGAILVQAKARETKFIKADLSNANLSAINLFKGSLRMANLTRTDLKLSNLYGVDFYKAKFSKTILIGSNIKRTLLQLRETP